MRYRNRPLYMLAGVAIAPIAFGMLAHEGAAGNPAPKKRAPITFATDIAPIIQKNCAECHRPGEVAPFNLLSYEDTKKRAKQIAAVTKTKFMPPWKVESNGEFHDERKLTDAQIKLISDWADAGAPLGDPKLLPPTPKFRNGWKLGEPDRVIGMEKPYKLGAEGRDEYRCFVVPTTYDADRWLSAMQFKPGNAKIVHHIIAYLDTTGAARKKLDPKDPGAGYAGNGAGPGFIPSGFLGGWAPGSEPRWVAKGTGILLPKGGDIVLEVHYHKSGKEETDKSQVALYFAKWEVDKRVRVAPIINPFFMIPPGAENHLVAANLPIREDITVGVISPHMHLLGRKMQVEAALPDGTKKQLVNVNDWDFNWQLTYEFVKPMSLPKGTNLNLKAYYDNSSSNPRQPSNPPKPVGWGEQTTDEMCIAFVGYTVDREHLTKGVQVDNVSREFGRGQQKPK